MARVFVTGSSDGLGLAAGRLLVAQGHEVVLHARSERRADETRAAAPGAADVLVADLGSLDGVRSLAGAANASGRFDAVIHNAGVGYRAGGRVVTPDGLVLEFAVNVVAPYLLMALMTRPDRLVHLSSGMHRGGNPSLDDLQWERRRWDGTQAYSDSKLFDVMLACGAARRWPDVRSNAVDPGWVRTRMGGRGAPGGIEEGSSTQAWLAVSDDAAAAVSGRYFHHHREQRPAPAALDEAAQDALLDHCADLTGTPLP